MRELTLIAMIALGLLQGAAFLEGLQYLFGIGALISIVIFVIGIMLGLAGGFLTGIVAFFGAWKGWHWEWYWAFLTTLPFIVAMFAVAGNGGLSVAFRDSSRRAA